jgi:transcription elongation GreA/GreB family factor
MSVPDKPRLLEAIRTVVRDDLKALLRVTADARDEATGTESKAENQYDTRATEASYLAAGQGKRLLSLRALAEWLDQLDGAPVMSVVGPGALVALVRDDGPPGWLLVCPSGISGGLTVEVDGTPVQVVSIDSPLGGVLDGLRAGDAEEVDTPRGAQVLEVVAVR